MKHNKQTTQRFFCMLLVAALFCALLTACGTQPLPDGMDENAVQNSAETTIRLLNDADYAALMDTMDDKMKAAATAEEWAATWSPVHKAAGEFVQLDKSNLFGKDGFAVAVVTAKYENATITFTLSYDTALRCAGIYFK